MSDERSWDMPSSTMREFEGVEGAIHMCVEEACRGRGWTEGEMCSARMRSWQGRGCRGGQLGA
jgi:hypothetical protein